MFRIIGGALIIVFLIASSVGVLSLVSEDGMLNFSCLLQTALGASCPQNSSAFALTVFHLQAFQDFYTGTLELALILGLLLALGVLFSTKYLLVDLTLITSSPRLVGYGQRQGRLDCSQLQLRALLARQQKQEPELV